MTYPTIAEFDLSKGLHVLFIYANEISGGIFVPMMLFSFYMIVLLGTYFAQKNTTGKGDIPVSMAVAGFLITLVAGLLRLAGKGTEGAPLVSLPTLTICIVAFIIGVALLFLTKSEEGY